MMLLYYEYRNAIYNSVDLATIQRLRIERVSLFWSTTVVLIYAQGEKLEEAHRLENGR